MWYTIENVVKEKKYELFTCTTDMDATGRDRFV